LINKRLASEAMHCHDLVAFVLYNIPLPTCSFLSSHTVLPEHEHTVLSLSHTPALLAMTPTRVSGSSLLNGPSCFLDTTILRPIISQICIGLSRNTEPIPLLFTVTVPKTPLALSGLDSFLARTKSQMPPVDSAPCEISPDSRTVAWYVPGAKPRMVRSMIVMVLDTCTMRMRPRTGSSTEEECVSRIQTAALSDLPVPRRIASRPVS